MNYYVEASAVKNGMVPGRRPFRTIGEAARIARPAIRSLWARDIQGVCGSRKWRTQEHPIVYRSERKGGAHITGGRSR